MSRRTNFDRVTEQNVADAAMQVLIKRPSGEAPIQTLIREIPTYLELSEADLAPSKTRPGEAVWEQQLRNITSHHNAEGNYIREGYLARVKGGLRLTDSGRQRLNSN